MLFGSLSVWIFKIMVKTLLLIKFRFQIMTSLYVHTFFLFFFGWSETFKYSMIVSSSIGYIAFSSIQIESNFSLIWNLKCLTLNQISFSQKFVVMSKIRARDQQIIISVQTWTSSSLISIGLNSIIAQFYHFLTL